MAPAVKKRPGVYDILNFQLNKELTMKKLALVFTFGFVMSIPGCSYYKIINEGASAGDIRSYSTISVGWLDLGDNKWRHYGFVDKDRGNWIGLIDRINTASMPEYMQQNLPEKKISVVTARNQEP
jgi:hypothetical protein